MMLMNYIFSNKKFQSLFEGSLEMQKFNFVETLIETLNDSEVFDRQYLNKVDQ